LIRTLLFILVVAGLAGIVLSLLRRTPKVAREQDGDTTTVAALPALPAANALSPATALRMLYEVAFGTALADSVPAEHVKVVTSVAAALGAAATDPKYAPRRPMLLPQLLRAVNDSDTTRRELAQLVARDPALVGGLLKLANSPLYRRGNQPIEGIERALAVLGTEGARSLVAAALVQPVFRTGSDTAKFPEIVWEHTYRAAASAEVHAAAVEGADLFAAQLIALVYGLGEIVVYRVAQDQYKARGLEPDATALASLLEEHAAAVAHRIAASWELSERVLEALEDQGPGVDEARSALGRSLRFGRVAGALSVLRANDIIDDDVGVASLAAAGGSGQRFERLWGRLSWPQK
jgi:HD-like signal output (HDOD) protein